MAADRGKRARAALDALTAGVGGAQAAGAEGGGEGGGGGAAARALAAFGGDGRVLAPPSAACRAWDRSDFLLRLATFKARTWFAKPAACASAACARRGWHNAGVDTLECAACKAQLVYDVPKGLPRAQALQRARRFAEQLGSAHAEGCGWRHEECALSLAAFPRLELQEAREDYTRRAGMLDARVEAAPCVDEAALVRALAKAPADAARLEAALSGQAQAAALPEAAGGVQRSAAYQRAMRCLALAGWTAAELPYCVRSPSAAPAAGETPFSELSFAPAGEGGHERASAALRCVTCGAAAALWQFAAGAARPRTGRFGRPLSAGAGDGAFSPPPLAPVPQQAKPAPPKRTPAHTKMDMPKRPAAPAPAPAPAAAGATPRPEAPAALSLTIAGGALSPGASGSAGPASGPFGAGAPVAPVFGLGFGSPPVQAEAARQQPQAQAGADATVTPGKAAAPPSMDGPSNGTPIQAHAPPPAVPPVAVTPTQGEDAAASGPLFNPLRAHRLHCPWVASPGGAPPGWQRLLDALVPGSGDGESSVKRPRTSGSADTVENVRALLKSATKSI